MARRRFFVDRIEDGAAELRGEEAHHLTRVLRAEAGQQYEISNGQDLYLARIRAAGKSSVFFDVVERLGSPKPLPQLTLYMALIKFDRFEWAIEKATELGVTAIIPVECARSEAGLMAASVKRSERWRKIVKESSQQSRRLAPPEIRDAQRAEMARPAGMALRMEEEGGCPTLMEALRNASQEMGISLMVGPEGGWLEKERCALDAAGWQRASLGSLILRAETAAIAALSVAGQQIQSRAL